LLGGKTRTPLIPGSMPAGYRISGSFRRML
jgi:hypothetical protein